MLKPVLLLTHLGMGDMLVINGLVRHLCARRPSVSLVCKQAYARSVGFMLRDVSNLQLVPVESDADISPAFGAPPDRLHAWAAAGFELMLLGLHSCSAHWAAGHANYADALYAQAGLPAYVRYTGFWVCRDPAREQELAASLAPAEDAPYLFVHEDPERGFLVHPPASPLHRVDAGRHSDNIFDYCSLIERAQQVHVFDSCFAHLVDLLALAQAPLLHCYVKNPQDSLETLFARPGWQFHFTSHFPSA